MSSTGINGTSPVGIFAAGASSYGCLDMSGNVSEWCLSKFKPYPYQEEDGRNKIDRSDEQVVLRGGAFDLRSQVGALRLPCPRPPF